MSYYRPRTSAPPDDEIINPYGQVWLPIAIQVGIVLMIVAAIYLVFRFFTPTLPRLVVQIVDLILALFPFALWLLVTTLAERRAPQPRPRLLMVALVTALAANAIALPLIEGVYQVERWLPFAPTLNRVLGYTFTIGVTQELIKYVVIRYAVWRDHFRTRLDAVAYGVASAVGYATVLNIQLALTGDSNLDIVGIRVFDNLALNIAGSILIAFGTAEMRFERPTPFLMALMVALGAFLTGVVIPLRTGLTNSAFSAQAAINAPSLIFGTIVSLIIIVAIAVPTALLFATAERRQREAAATRDR